MSNVPLAVEPQSRASHRRYPVLLCVAYLLAALVPLTVGVVRPGITGYSRAMLEDMVYGRAHQPFVRRQLVPLVVRSTTALLPQSIRHQLTRWFADSRLVERLRWPPAYATEFVVSLLVMYASMVGFLVVLRALLLGCYDMPPGMAHVVVLAVGISLPITFAGKLYIYDPTQLCLYTGALACLQRRNWWLFYPVFALACVNKETSLLIPLCFVFWRGRRVFRLPWCTHAFVAFMVGFAICTAQAWMFRHNPGTLAEWHIERNVSLSFSPLGWMRLGILTVATIVAISHFRSAPPFLSRGLVATLPGLLLSTFLLGYIDELRNFYEALPFLIGLAVGAVGKRMGVRLRRSPAGRDRYTGQPQ